MKQAMIAQSTRPANRFWRDRWEPINGNSFGIRLSRLAWMIERLFPPCRRNPLAYHERKSEIVSELKALAALAVGELKTLLHRLVQMVIGLIPEPNPELFNAKKAVTVAEVRRLRKMFWGGHR